MVPVRSIAIWRLTEGGSAAWSCGSTAFTLSTVWMMLAPGVRNRSTRIAGLLSDMPILRTSSTPSVTCATSVRRTAAPLR